VKLVASQIRNGITDVDTAFSEFARTLRPSLKLWNYFVNWDKVFRNTTEMEIQLNTLNFLLGKDDFDTSFRELLTRHPEVVRALPSLVVRDGAGSKTFSIVQDLANLKAPEKMYDFGRPADTPQLRDAALEFVKETGLIRIFHKSGVKNLVDYVLGVEAGLDSNGRKNRSGSSMESVVQKYLEIFCESANLKFISQANPTAIKSQFGFAVPVDKSSRIFDFAVTNGKKLVLIEVNFYGGGGSKLKATAGEYIGLYELLTAHNVEFVWVTDGEGWKTTMKPLEEAFKKVDYVWNLNGLSDGYLADVFGIST
jgi:type II restriction enzyme